MEPLLPIIWSAIIAFALFMYVIMDGFDLGVGILFGFARESEKSVMMGSVAPVWDGNETWLILAGAGLLAAFPLAYAIILPALYLPFIIMLMALIFRGVAFEFRFKANLPRRFWDLAFHAGSVVATFAQGIIIGAIVEGLPVEGRSFAGETFVWLSPFSVLSGCGLVAGYALLGSTWLILKTDSEVQAWAYDLARRWLPTTAGFLVVIFVWTLIADGRVAERWLTWPDVLYALPLPVLAAIVVVGLYRAVARGREQSPFVLALLLFLVSYLTLAVSFWPYVIPPAVTIWQAASAPGSQLFLLPGIAVLIPVILCYTAFSYYVFRGKVRADITEDITYE